MHCMCTAHALHTALHPVCVCGVCVIESVQHKVCHVIVCVCVNKCAA